ncbi:MAG: tRNA (cytidine(34)-2'-O)-methyltransferase, partial [Candidatus Ornithospirochaeta sp.]
MLYICLVEPEIPQNTGNIARTAAATGSVLVLVHPLGFDISEKAVRRSGLDYWKDVEKIEYGNKEEFFSSIQGKEFWLFSAHGEKRYTDISFPQDKDIYLIFGKE